MATVRTPSRTTVGPVKPATADVRGRPLDPARLGDHVDRLYRAAWAMCGRREDAEDLVQETYANVLARPRRLRHDDDLAYLLRALRNTHVSRARSRGRRPAEVSLEVSPEPADDRSATSPEGHLATAHLFAAIAALPTPFREAIVAIDVAGLSYREAGTALGVREATVTTRLHRARRRLAADLADPPRPEAAT